MNYAIILAGGTGSRFWPLSKADEPKQFLKLYCDQPMIEVTLSRVSGLINRENIYLATNKSTGAKIKKAAAKFKIPLANIIFEPEYKNTLAPIAVISKIIRDKDPKGVVFVLPCDHYIGDSRKYEKKVKTALRAAKEGNIITFGVIPTSPETGYGYIKSGPSIKTGEVGEKCFKVAKFIEKPSLAKAKIFYKDKKYFWNSGMFVFLADVLLKEVKKYAPKTFSLISLMGSNKNRISALWKKFTFISVDYAIMQRTKKAAFMPLGCGWSDLGSWKALDEVIRKDKNSNILKGKAIDIGSNNIISWPDKGTLITIGLKDIVVVKADHNVLVCSKDKAQDVKKAVAILNKAKRNKR